MNFSYDLKIPSLKNKKSIENFFINKNLESIVELSKKPIVSSTPNKMQLDEAYTPELNDLYRLYQYILINKRTTIFEFGSGWSTLIFSLALKELRDKFSEEVKLLRRNNPFELFVLENEKKYLNITRDRIKKFNKYLNIKNPIEINYSFSDVEMTLLNN